VRAKNTKNILLKNVLDACLGGLIWWTIGYPIALGDIGGETKDNVVKPFFIDRVEGENTNTNYYALWMFQWSFAAAAATIVSVRPHLVFPFPVCVYERRGTTTQRTISGVPVQSIHSTDSYVFPPPRRFVISGGSR
jgi:hypothetical protein